MAVSIRAPATPAVLVWARESAGYSLAQAAEQIKVSEEDLVSWEDPSDEAIPTARALEQMANLYKRPLAIFFFPKPPKDPPATRKFRTLDVEAFEPDTLYAVRQAKSRQLALAELTRGQNPLGEELLTRQLHPHLNEPKKALANRVRIFLSFSLERQTSWKSTEEGFKWCRSAIERSGVFVFKRPFKQEDVSGFCLTDPEFPVIYVNNSHSFERQLFTLFHELAHLIYEVDGVTASDAQVEQAVVADRKLEVKCNAMAGELLVPTSAFKESVEPFALDVDTVAALAKRFRVSREVILRRGVDVGYMHPDEYAPRVKALNSTYARGKESSGGDYYRNQATYLGQAFLRLGFSRLSAGLVTEDQLAQYTGVRAANLAKLENLVNDATS